ncbi:DNA polymerase IV [Microbacteriaceae bacterium 4G12]
MREMYPKKGRVILHVDMNSFFASVEMAYDPSLKGKPLAVAGDEKKRKGIIITCSYEARAYGIYTTMPLWEAKRRCPQLIVKQPNFERYRKASFDLFQLLSQFTEMIQPVSIDEAYLDITDSYELGSPLEIAQRIQKEVQEQLDLPCSIGIAPNKFLAKMASDMKKPLGITILRKRDVQTTLWARDVEDMHGIGKKTAEKLNQIGIITIKDLAQAEEGPLRDLLGVNGPLLKQRANGVDTRPVDVSQMLTFKTIGNSMTLPKDSVEEPVLFEVLHKLATSVSTRLKKRNFVTYNVQLTVKYYNRKTMNRSKKLENPIVDAQDIFSAASRLWKAHWDGEPVRLLGITACDLEEKTTAIKQLDLFSFEEDAKEEPLLHALEELREKYGDHIIQRGHIRGQEEKQSFRELLEQKYL